MFKSFGLNDELLRGITKSNYKQPTPIQRKVIPFLMSKTSVVAMSRTGSGKSASFLIPLIHHLSKHSNTFGCRALVLSPTRELSIQLHSHYQILSKYTDLRAILLVGGDSLDEQFGAFSSNPDVIFATPGRLLHILVEMDRKLPVEFLIYDEVDRLFEQGFSVQLHEISTRIPNSSKRTTGFFSATLPNNVLEFTQSVCVDPILIKLDSEHKLSPELNLEFFYSIPEYKEAALLYVLSDIIKVPTGVQQVTKITQFAGDKQTIIFCATKHHVEYLSLLLKSHNYAVAHLYGTLDQSIRNIQTSRFRQAQCPILITTDIAARGIDIPILQYVINYEIPIPKIFIHRVGRVARAGRSGAAYTLVSRDDLPYFYDLNETLGNTIVYGDMEKPQMNDMRIGGFPKFALDRLVESIQRLKDPALVALKSSKNHSQLKYSKSLPKASGDAYVFGKIFVSDHLKVHLKLQDKLYNKPQQDLVASIFKYRPKETIFEVGLRKNKCNDKKQLAVNSIIMRDRVLKSKKNVVKPKAQLDKVHGFDGICNDYKCEYYLDYKQEKSTDSIGYSVIRNAQDVEDISLALPDDVRMQSGIKQKLGKMVWDAKKRKFIKIALGKNNQKLIKTESGTVLPASYKSDRFDKWKKKNNVHLPRDEEAELKQSHNMHCSANTLGKSTEFKRKHGNKKLNSFKAGAGLKSATMITKDRKVKEKLKMRNGRKPKGRK
eukprot:NODE_86_length_22163_cov_0.379442.p1 type:complete len:716 gc:universal NODE_86_length_22163_cov_0.379442:15885-18032(+)